MLAKHLQSQFYKENAEIIGKKSGLNLNILRFSLYIGINIQNTSWLVRLYDF